MTMTTDRQSQAMVSAKPYGRWLRFERLASAYSHPDRIGDLLPEGLPGKFRDRLQGSSRLGPRLSALLAKQLAPCTLEDLATPEGRFVQLEGKDLESALRRIGAIWHARTIRKIILSEPLRELIERLGRDNHRAALRFMDLAPEDDVKGSDGEAGDDAVDLDALLGSIDRDALIAVNAWCRQQPAALAERFRLKLRPCPEVDDEPPVSHQDRGAMIVDRVVMTLAADVQAGTNAHG